jgi:hypothetical protein
LVNYLWLKHQSSLAGESKWVQKEPLNVSSAMKKSALNVEPTVKADQSGLAEHLNPWADFECDE